jgi:hypothetical protein
MRRKVFIFAWISVIIIALVGLLISATCKVSAYAVCEFAVTKSFTGWISLLATCIVMPGLFIKEISSKQRYKLLLHFGIGILITRAFYVGLPRSLISSGTGDFQIYYAGMQSVYSGGNPYNIYGSVTFPFPAFLIYYVVSLAGSLSEFSSYTVFWVLNLFISLSLCALSVFFVMRKIGRSDWQIIVPINLLNGVWLGLSQGQTTVLTAFCLSVFLIARESDVRRNRLVALFCLAVAVLLKPYLVVIVGAEFFVGLIKHSKPCLVNSLLIGIMIVVIASIPLFVSGGVTDETYIQFFANISNLGDVNRMSQTAFNGALYGNSSPVAAVTYVMQLLLKNDTSISVYLTSNLFSLVLVAPLIGVTYVYRKDDFDSQDIMNVWVVASVIIWKVSYTHYTAWILPSLCIMTVKSSSIMRCVLLMALVLMSFEIGWTSALAFLALMFVSVRVLSRTVNGARVPTHRCRVDALDLVDVVPEGGLTMAEQMQKR